MKKELNTNNSKKLFIGLSILFCTVILIIGSTIAFFTQSDSKSTGNIVTIDKVELEYNDNFDENKNYMRQELIPSSIDNVIKAYTRSDTQNKCLDDYGHSACSVYRFSIKNISDIAQELQMTLNPTVNSYTNLRFLLYEITEDENVLVMNSTELTKDSLTSISLYHPYVLKNNEEKIFEIVFYIEAKDYDQTSEDAGKTFGAGIRVDSITTGTYVAKNFGASCWNYEDTTLTKFNGINSDGSIKEECTGYVSQDNDGYYKVTVPSNIGGQPITTLGETLFFPVDVNTLEYTPLSKVKEYNIEEGIKEIKDGIVVNIPNKGEFPVGTFTSSGYNYFTQQEIVEGGVTINLPDSLMKIGNNAFSVSNINKITIPSNVESIGDNAFNSNFNLKFVTFEGASDGTSKLNTIGIGAFVQCDITSDNDNPLLIPASVEIIGISAFGATSSTNQNLTRITFVDEPELGYPSKLTSIGREAFYCLPLSYETEDDPLVLPPHFLNTIGLRAFVSEGDMCKHNLKFIKYLGGLQSILNNESNWYNPTDSTLLNQ